MTAVTHRAALAAVLDAATPLMTMAAGYHFDYAAANILDAKDWPAGKAVLFHSFGDDARNVNHRVVGFNTYDTLLRFRVLPPLLDDVPPQELAARAADDVARMMAAQADSMGAAGGMMLSAPARPQAVARLVRGRPVEQTIEYTLTWRQRYENPAP